MKSDKLIVHVTVEFNGSDDLFSDANNLTDDLRHLKNNHPKEVKIVDIFVPFNQENDAPLSNM